MFTFVTTHQQRQESVSSDSPATLAFDFSNENEQNKNLSENLPAHTFKLESFSLAEGTRVLPCLQLVFYFVVNVLS